MTPKGSKTKVAKVDFSSVDGLIAALKSPNVAAQDAARRGLIERGREDELLRMTRRSFDWASPA